MASMPNSKDLMDSLHYSDAYLNRRAGAPHIFFHSLLIIYLIWPPSLWMSSSLSSPPDEIRQFLWSKFRQIRQSHLLHTYIPHDWPTQQTMQNLVMRTSRQFIYAMTVMKYVDLAQHRPIEHLEAVLRIVNPLGNIPFAELDGLYCHILASAHNTKGVLCIVGALLCSQELYS